MTQELPLPRRLRPGSLLAVVGGLLVAASVVASAAARSALDDALRVRWTVGPSYHYGPETLPSEPVLVAVPALVLVAYVGLLVVGSMLDREAELAELRWLYDVGGLALLATLVLFQLALFAANLL